MSLGELVTDTIKMLEEIKTIRHVNTEALIVKTLFLLANESYNLGMKETHASYKIQFDTLEKQIRAVK